MTTRGKRHYRRHGRPGFSLAELMVAIGIFGIGMLMVAATFPVGLDQARIVSEESIAPLVANEAYATLRLLLDDPTPRVNLRERNGAFPNTPVTLRFSQALAPTAFTAILGDPINLNLWRDINDWLGSPHPSLRSDPNYFPIDPLDLGAGVRFYPSTPNGAANLPYTWCVLYGRSASAVTFMVFVTRRSTATPILIQGTIPDINSLSPNTFDMPVGVIDPLDWSNVFYELDQSAFEEGMLLVPFDNSGFHEVRSISPDPDYPGVILSSIPSIPTPTFWCIPVDPATGRSPVIAMYSRTFPLN